MSGSDIWTRWRTPSLAGLSFAFVKATEGKALADPMYLTHASNILRAGLHLGSYHFIRQGDPIEDQARFYVAHSAKAQALAVDNEGAHAMTRTGVRALIAAIRKYDPLHRKVGLYMSESQYSTGGYAACGQDFDWIANWGGQPRVSWDIWQYTSQPIDKDRMLSQAKLDEIFRVAPATHTLHIEHNATVRLYALGKTGCILRVDGKYGVDKIWRQPDSQAPCTAPVRRQTCDGMSQAMTVRVTAGAFAGKTVRVGEKGVTVT